MSDKQFTCCSSPKKADGYGNALGNVSGLRESLSFSLVDISPVNVDVLEASMKGEVFKFKCDKWPAR